MPPPVQLQIITTAQPGPAPAPPGTPPGGIPPATQASAQAPPGAQNLQAPPGGPPGTQPAPGTQPTPGAPGMPPGPPGAQLPGAGRLPPPQWAGMFPPAGPPGGVPVQVVPRGQEAGEGAEAGGAGAAEDMALAAAGPVGVAIMVAKEVLAKLTGAFDMFRRGVETTGQQLQALARNDHVAMFDQAVGAAAETLGQIPLVGEVFGAALRAAAAPVTAFTDVVEAFVQRGRELAQFSPGLAAAGARADITELLSDITEAMTIGPELARLTDAQTEARRELRELLLPIKHAVVTTLADLLTDMVDKGRNLDRGMENMGDLVRTLIQVTQDLAMLNHREASIKIRDLLQRIDARAQRAEDKEDSKKFLDDFNRALDQLAAGPPGRARAAGNDPVLQNRPPNLPAGAP
jgi:hypothetical protein